MVIGEDPAVTPGFEQPVSPGVAATRPVTSRSIYFSMGAFAGGNIAASLLRMVGGILTARVLEPAVLGLFNGIGLVLGYAPFLQLGILNGLNRELPYFSGRLDHARVEELAAAAQAWALAVGSIVAVALLGVGLWYAAAGEWQVAAGWTTNAFGAFSLFYGQQYLQVTYRTRHDFSRLAAFNVVQNAFALALVLVVWWLNFYGLCLRALAVGLLQMGLLWHWRPVRVAPRLDKRHLLHLLKIGAPIFGVGQLYAWWTVIDSTLVLKAMGVKGLGLYALAVMTGATLQLIPDSVSQVVYPRMAEKYGQGGNVHDLVQIAWKPTVMLVACMLPIVLFAWLTLPWVVLRVLPRYADAIGAARWAMLSPLVMSLGPALNIFNVIKRQDLYVVAVLVGMGSYYGLLQALLRHTDGLDAFPRAMVMGRLMFVVTSFAALYLFAKPRAAHV